MQAELIRRYLRNECSPAEVNSVVEWLGAEAGTKAGRAVLREVWDQYEPRQPDTGPELDRLLDRLHHRINLSEERPAAPRKLRAFWLQRLSRAAAILFLPVLAILLFTYWKGELLFGSKAGLSQLEVKTPPSSITAFTLPDGSQVWLNQGSTLKYPQQFGAGERRVELEGEAFFEVQSETRRPFQVWSGGLAVVATGTAFNVLAYPEDSTMEVTLVTGRVEIRRENATGGSQTIYTMKPDEHLTFQKLARKLIPAMVNTDKYIAWKDGRLIFDNDPLDVVSVRLARWYNAEVILEDPELSNYTYKATFISETLLQVLELMELATPITYDISPKEELPDGSYRKTQIVIRLKKSN